MSVKTRIAELNRRLADTLTEKGVAATAQETTTALVGKVGQISHTAPVDGVVFPGGYFTKHSGEEGYPFVTITADMLDGMITAYEFNFAYLRLQKLELPDTLIDIRANAFTGVVLKDPLIIPDSVKNIQTNAFSNSNIGQVVFGKGIQIPGTWFSYSTVHTLIFKGDILSTAASLGYQPSNLANLYFEGKIYGTSTFSYATLTADTIQRIIDALADLTGQEAQTLTLHSNHVDALTEEQWATIEAKNWNVG